MSKTISSVLTAEYLLSSASNPLSITGLGGVKVTAASKAIYGVDTQDWTVNNDGTVTATAGGSSGVSLLAGGSVDNGGLISGAGYGVRFGGIGSGSVTNTGTVLNSGTISSARDAVVLFGGGLVSNASTGVIASTGSTANVGVYLKGGGTVTNAGTITGGIDAVQFAGSYANRLIVDPGAVFNGHVVGGSGSNLLELAAGTLANRSGTLANLSTQVTNFGSILVDAGAAWTLVNPGSLAAGTRLYDQGTLTNPGSLAETGALIVLAASSAAAAGTLINTGTLALLSGSSAGYLNVSGSLTNTGQITFGAGASARVQGVLSGSGTVSGGGKLAVNGSLSAGLVSVAFLNNYANLSATAVTGITSLFNPGTITAALTLSSASTINNADGSIAGAITLTGGATLNSSYGHISGAGVYGITAANFLTNLSGSIGTTNGVTLAAGGSVTNGEGGTIVGGGDYGVRISGGSGSVSNSNAGSIAASGKVAVGLLAGGSIYNGTGGVLRSTSFAAAYVRGGAGTVTNGVGGTIASANGVELLGGGGVTNAAGGVITGTSNVGVYLKGGGTVLNAGTITGGVDAVQFAGSYVNTLVALPGAAFTGAVVGGSASNRLELASASGTGTITGFASQFTGFGTIAVDSGANWSLGDIGTLSSGTTLTDSGTLTVIDGLSNSGLLNVPGALILVNAPFTSPSTAVNAGAMTVGGTLELVAGSTYAAPVMLVNSGSLTNSGLISVGGVNPSQYYSTSVPSALTNTGILLNNGIIESYGFGASVTVTSTGTVSGSGTVDVTLGTLANYGSITASSIRAGSVYNDGSIAAAVTLTGGATLSNAAGGTITGAGVVGITEANVVTNAASIGGTSGPMVGIDLQAGGSVSNTGSIAGQTSGVQVAGGAGTITNAGTITGGVDAVNFIGGSANRLIVDPGAVFNGAVVGGSGSNVLELAAGNGAGTLSGFSAQFTNFGSIAVDAGASWSLGANGTIGSSVSIGSSGTLTFSEASGSLTVGGIISGSGALVQSGSGNLVLSANDSYTGGSSIAGGTLELSARNAAATHPIGFTGTAALRADGTVTPTGTISGFTLGDVIDLPNLSNPAPSLGTLSGNTLSFVAQNGTHSPTTYHLQLSSPQGFVNKYFHVFSDGAGGTDLTVDSVACFCPGTRIRTDHGELPVETLRIGDRVVTCAGPLQPILWIGRRSYGGPFLAGRPQLRPVRIQAGALADGVPQRDLVVSPLHALCLDNVLVPAGLLVNGASVTQPEVDEVHYLHIELATHDLVWAEGAAAETFVDDDSRGMFHNAAEFAALYPDAPRRRARYCAERVEDGYAVEAIRQRLAERAGLPRRRSVLGPLRGFVDRVTLWEIEGWAQDCAHPEMPVCLDVQVDGQVVAQVLAGAHRADLEAAGLGSGCHSFALRLAGAIRPGQSVEICRSADGSTLPDATDAARASLRQASAMRAA